jgi:uncharacterized protein YqgV (UPF0045/DUF77 family)
MPKKRTAGVKPSSGTSMRTTMESEWEALLNEMRKAREYGVPGIGSPEIADVERKLERVVRSNRESMRAAKT